MKPVMRSLQIVAFGCCLWSLPVMLRAADLFGFDVPKQYPKAYASYKAILPPQYKKISWVRMLDGTSGPLKDVEVNGGPAVLFWMCEPHNCGGNELAVLLRKDGKRAAALFESADHTAGKKVYFGKPSEAEIALLLSAFQ
jgi:Inhibitor of vertebrate lysozyme (Ivy)